MALTTKLVDILRRLGIDAYQGSYTGPEIDTLLGMTSYAAGSEVIRNITTDVNNAVEAAEAAAESAEASASRSPYIGENGNWYVFDVQQGAFTDTGIAATGPTGAQGPRGQVFVPAVSGEGVLSWTVQEPTSTIPESRNIRGPQGVQGVQGPRGYPATVNGVTPDASGAITLTGDNIATSPSDAHTLAAKIAKLESKANIMSFALPAGRIRGDVNGDGVIDSKDSDLLSHMYGKLPDDPDLEERAADINGDGYITGDDLLILNTAAYLAKKYAQYSEDLLGNWLKNPNYMTESGQYYFDIAVPGITSASDVSVFIGGSVRDGTIDRIDRGNGYIRIYAIIPPVKVCDCCIAWTHSSSGVGNTKIIYNDNTDYLLQQIATASAIYTENGPTIRAKDWDEGSASVDMPSSWRKGDVVFLWSSAAPGTTAYQNAAKIKSVRCADGLVEFELYDAQNPPTSNVKLRALQINGGGSAIVIKSLLPPPTITRDEFAALEARVAALEGNA